MFNPSPQPQQFQGALFTQGPIQQNFQTNKNFKNLYAPNHHLKKNFNEAKFIQQMHNDLNNPFRNQTNQINYQYNNSQFYPINQQNFYSPSYTQNYPGPNQTYVQPSQMQQQMNNNINVQRPNNQPQKQQANNQSLVSKAQLWSQVLNELRNDKQRKKEYDSKEIPCQNGKSLKFKEKKYGKQPPEGYTMFICLHGGGGCSKSVNDDQWDQQPTFFERGFRDGCVAVSPRGISDTWNCHFVDESFPALARLVENYIIFGGVNPNRIYLIGFSAGGDGVYALSERLPFLFAACSPQAGHPNDIGCENLSNLPMYLAVGENDSAYKRNTVAVEYYNRIIALNSTKCGNFKAHCEVVKGSGHCFWCAQKPREGFFDGSKTSEKRNYTAFDFLYENVRNPAPSKLTCNVDLFLTKLGNYYTPRGKYFYYIEVDEKNHPKEIMVNIDFNNNTINVTEGKGFKLNLCSEWFKNGKIVKVVGKEFQAFNATLECNQNKAKQFMKLLCDPNYGFDSTINIP